MNTDWPLTRDLVLIGGGHTHALVLRQWGMKPLPGVRVTLINPGPGAPYSGMLPGHIAGHYSRGELDIDLVRLARFAGARTVFDRACGIDTQARLVHLEGRAPLRYDVASLDIGVTADLPSVPGFAEHAHPVKPLGPFASAWQVFLEQAARPEAGADCIVIGAGVAGVELALAMAHRMQQAGLARASVTLLEARPEILTGTGAQVRKILIGASSGYGIKVVTQAEPVRITAHTVELADGQSLPADFIVSAAGARPYPWIAATGLACTDGFVDVGPDLRAVSHPDIFAAGDCAHLTHAPRPKAGVYAVREAPVLFDNLQAVLSGRKLRPYNPQTDYLKLISTGGKSAAGQKHVISLSGSWVWKLKDHIDTTFMARLNELPPMAAPPAPALRALDDDEGDRSEILCGGCGSKVGRPSLIAALAGASLPVRPDTISGIGDDAAVLQIGGRLQVISTDHLRAFTEDPYLLARIAAVHALGDVWSMGASPQSALLSLVIPRMSERMQAGTISEVVAAVSDVLHEAGADLVGGHTSMGRELTVGLTVTGLLDGPAIGLSGARPGDVLLLTKSIGTGVILAAEMRGLARGSDVESALRSMQRPLGAAARILTPAAHAMTDVTGFGLAGHMMSLLEASNVAARISLSRVPLLSGAEELAGQGVKSSIWRSNASLEPRVSRPASAISDLIYDPQTAGGLLAAIPAGAVPAILAAFEAAGEPAFLIGEIVDGAPFITVD
ncbi:MAG: selenide, water dikinase SelD [Hyphomonas sp.]|uniref:selenide, water dikinase SelD n=1 Tax=Hyphomonas sp. TaxID=87 RepID=UPI0017B49BC4|nr:selenide, water dikinase SelD [Hyphomonas sp.]MBU3921726.1 selenide, water dikinase SelD [Alphaproteobacteria bacterium]MBA3070103.1 selenide, water dikinase SelD [Hyphomonas sp.]MBU4060321.1 selenide, water dikinase SelD [Alphaproteobacteria bacterium]MBU4162989.1 selenide, water dikinase SelD [Alphaproteobacteria bacterium]MBU4569470.1 selenide, water dikinase SelD [Alphaproteobacteria bacterium]